MIIPLNQSTESGGALVFPHQAFAIGKNSHTTTEESRRRVCRDCSAYSNTPRSQTVRKSHIHIVGDGLGIGCAVCVCWILGDYVKEYVQGTFLFWSIVHVVASSIAFSSMYLAPGGSRTLVKMENGCLYLVKSGFCDMVFAVSATVQHDCAVTALAVR